VGSSFNGTADQPLNVHWNGTRWRQVRGPSPGITSGLDGVAAASSRNIWAVGDYFSGAITQALIVHWNGTRWRRVDSPNPGSDDRLLGVVILSRTSVMAAGYYANRTAFQTLFVRWDGTRWRRVPRPDPGGSTHDNFQFCLGAASARSIWAVGKYSNGSFFKNLAIRCC
jgi:hypothetical protein